MHSISHGQRAVLRAGVVLWRDPHVRPEENERVNVVTRDFVEVRSYFHHHEGTNDYTNSGTEIVEIVNRDGESVQPVEIRLDDAD